MRRFPRPLFRLVLVLGALLLAGCGGPRALDRTDATAVAQAWLAAVAAQDDHTAQALYFSPNDPLAALRGQGTVDLYRHFIGPDGPALQYGAVTAPPSLQWVDVTGGSGAALVSLPYVTSPHCAEFVMVATEGQWGIVGVQLAAAAPCEHP